MPAFLGLPSWQLAQWHQNNVEPYVEANINNKNIITKSNEMLIMNFGKKSIMPGYHTKSTPLFYSIITTVNDK